MTNADVIVVHSSDLHVDDSYTARAFGGDGNGPLRCVLGAAEEAEANIVLLTGDIFEHNRLPDTLSGDREDFERLIPPYRHVAGQPRSGDR